MAMSCGVGRRLCSDPVLLWLWRRPAATAPILRLAWEPPYATGAALKRLEKGGVVMMQLKHTSQMTTLLGTAVSFTLNLKMRSFPLQFDALCS